MSRKLHSALFYPLSLVLATLAVAAVVCNFCCYQLLLATSANKNNVSIHLTFPTCNRNVVEDLNSDFQQKRMPLFQFASLDFSDGRDGE